MKIKSDFVTNSSSSSFVVMGVQIDTEQIPVEILEAIQKKHPELNDVKPEELFDKYVYDVLDCLVDGSDLSSSYGYEYEGYVMVGLQYTIMDDNETLGQFKERAKQLILEKLGVEVEKVYHIEDCWMDG
jgi:hypothetical protein